MAANTRWRKYASPAGFLDFKKAFAADAGSWRFFYAYVGVVAKSSHNRTAQLRMDSFWPLRVYLNGKEVFCRQGPNADRPTTLLLMSTWWLATTPSSLSVRKSATAALSAGRGVCIFASPMSRECRFNMEEPSHFCDDSMLTTTQDGQRAEGAVAGPNGVIVFPSTDDSANAARPSMPNASRTIYPTPYQVEPRDNEFNLILTMPPWK